MVFDDDSLADEGVTRYFAALADFGVLLDLDEGAYLRLVADLTPIEIDKLRQPHILAKLDVV
jgi:hypothetical protein